MGGEIEVFVVVFYCLCFLLVVVVFLLLVILCLWWLKDCEYIVDCVVRIGLFDLVMLLGRINGL